MTLRQILGEPRDSFGRAARALSGYRRGYAWVPPDAVSWRVAQVTLAFAERREMYVPAKWERQIREDCEPCPGGNHYKGKGQPCAESACRERERQAQMCEAFATHFEGIAATVARRCAARIRENVVDRPAKSVRINLTDKESAR